MQYKPVIKYGERGYGVLQQEECVVRICEWITDRPDDGGSNKIWNVGLLKRDCMVKYSRWLSSSRNSMPFMGTESSLPFSQEHSTCPCYQPAESSPHFCETHFNIFWSILSEMTSSLQVLWPLLSVHTYLNPNLNQPVWTLPHCATVIGALACTSFVPADPQDIPRYEYWNRVLFL